MIFAKLTNRSVPVSAHPTRGGTYWFRLHTNWMSVPLALSWTFQERDLPELQAVETAVFNDSGSWSMTLLLAYWQQVLAFMYTLCFSNAKKGISLSCIIGQVYTQDSYCTTGCNEGIDVESKVLHDRSAVYLGHASPHTLLLLLASTTLTSHSLYTSYWCMPTCITKMYSAATCQIRLWWQVATQE